MSKIKFVAELTINHLGMVAIAKQMIKAAKDSGATLIKLKLKNVNKYYNDENKKWRNFNFKEYRGSLELSKEDFVKLDLYCKSLNIKWFCTVHDKESLDFLTQFDLPLYKIASMDADKQEFVNYVLEICKNKNKPMVISIGGKSLDFTDKLINRINETKIKVYLLHTVSLYPTPIGKSNINFIDMLINKYSSKNIEIGYSGHEIGYAPTILAALKGVTMIERHFTLTRKWNIHHINASLTPQEYKEMTSIIENIILEKNNNPTEFYKRELEFLKQMEYK